MMKSILQSPKCVSYYFHYHLLLLSIVSSCCIIFSASATAADEDNAPIVRTSKGRLRGQTVQQPGGGAADLFYGIPYAQPPVGELRFEKTRPAKSWKGVRNATTVPAQCLQWVRPTGWDTSATVRAQFSEDCLYMNLFRPHTPDESYRQSKPLLPVLAIIHGGGFQRGSARRYQNTTEIGQKYLSQGILVVVLQFRIGVLGEASDGSDRFRGNFAYWDMAEALRLLRAELPAFGGDPQRITAFGYSSGSSSVGTLSISPQTRHLFAQQVLMSGLVMSVRSASDQVAVETRKLAQAVGCSSANGTIKRCLKTRTVDQLFAGVDLIGSTRVGLNYVKFGPRLDGDFLPHDFPKLMRNSKPKPTIIGINEMEPLQSVLFGANESLHWDAVPWALFPTYGADNFEEYIRRMMVHPAEFGNQTDNLVRDMMDFYLGSANGTKGPDFYLEKLVQVMADLQFIVPMAYDLQLRAPRSNSRAPLFAYFNKYVNARFFPAQVHLHRPFHDNDHSYVFRNPASSYQFDAQDEHIERYHTQQLVNFVKTGNPSTNSVAWTPVAANKPLANQMLIQLPSPGMGQMPLDGIQFWSRMTVKYPQFNLIMGRRDANPLE